MEKNSVDGQIPSDGPMMVMMMTPLLYKLKMELLLKQESHLKEAYCNMLNLKVQLKSI